MRSCCSASSSVGAISAVWQPASATASAASSAITVLPLPTSPSSRRCIGCGRARSARTSRQTLAWARVSRNGKLAAAALARSPAAAIAIAALARPALAPQREAELEQIELLEHQPRVGGGRAGAQRREIAVERRLMQLAQRLRRLRQRELADQRRRQVGRQQVGVVIDGVLDGAAQRARVDALGRGVVGRDAAQLGAAGRIGTIAAERFDLGMQQLLREAVALHVAGDEQQVVLAHELRDRLAAAEPLEGDGSGLVAHDRFEAAPAAPAPPRPLRARSRTPARARRSWPGAPPRALRPAPASGDRPSAPAGGRADPSRSRDRAGRAPRRAWVRRRAAPPANARAPPRTRRGRQRGRAASARARSRRSAPRPRPPP